MVTYNQFGIQLQEVPGEICLSFYICDCPIHCQGCSSPWLWDRGKYVLTPAKIKKAIEKFPYATCIMLGGDSSNHADLVELAAAARQCGRKVALYSGWDGMDPLLEPLFDYYKVGPWRAEKGPLNNPGTNQRMYARTEDGWIDITERYQTREARWHAEQEEHLQ